MFKRYIESVRKFLNTKKDGIDFLTYTIYKFICSSFYKKKTEILNDKQIADFHLRKVLVLPSLITQDKVEIMANSLLENLKNNRIKPRHCLMRKYPKRKIARILLYIYDRLFKNSIIYYEFPSFYLNQVYQIFDPLRHLKAFKHEIQNNLIYITNELMNSKSNIHKAVAYKTININQNETKNVNGSLHRDGDVWTAIKCIIYLTDVDINSGPFCYQDENGEVIPVLGKKGTVIFFKSSSLRHMGANTKTKERLAAGFTSYPNFKNEINDFELAVDFERKTVPFLPYWSKVILHN